MAQGKKGLPIWAWFGIGCAVLLVLVIIVFVIGGIFVAKKVQDVAGDFENNPEMAAARLIVRMNPEIEEVEVDEDAGTIRVREKKTGKEYTASIDDLKEGRFSIVGEDGEVVVKTEGVGDDGDITITTGDGSVRISGNQKQGDRPDWVPIPPGASVEGQYSMTSDDAAHGTLQVVPGEGGEDVLAFYENFMEEEGYAVQRSSFSGDGETVTILQGRHEATGRTLIVNVTSSDEETKVGLTYSEGS